MKRLFLCAVTLTLAAVFLFGCKKAPEDRMLAHVTAAIGILETNKDDPDKAADELQKYFDSNKADMEAMMKEIQELDQGMSDEEKEKKGKEMEAKMGDVMKRITKLQSENPKLFTNEKVAKAWASFMPGM